MIAFVSDRDGNPDIYVANADGTNPRNLTNHPASDLGPAWSPDGQTIAFYSLTDLTTDIYVMDGDGANVRNVAYRPGADDSFPAWSPDGQTIAFTSVQTIHRDGEIYTMNEDGGDIYSVTNHQADDVNPAWSPDGRSFAFESDRDGNPEIYVMNTDGTDLRNLTNHPATDLGPTWSPDGQTIALSSARDGNDEIYVMNADGTNLRNLTNHPAGDLSPAWSPYAQTVAFVSHRDGDGEIYVMNADGTNPRNLTNHPANYSTLTWSPDGRRIAFSREESILRPPAGGVVFSDPQFEIYVMEADGANVRKLTTSLSSEHVTGWWGPPFAAITSLTANQVLPAGTTSTALTVDIANRPELWHWELDQPPPASGLAGGSRVTDGNTATIVGLEDGSTHTVYVVLADVDGNVLSPPATASVTFSVNEVASIGV